jgi:hypothetical protein
LIVELLAWFQPAAAAAAAPAPAGDAGLVGQVLELGKLVGGGAAGTFALLAWQALRTERSTRDDASKRDERTRSERQRELDSRLERMGTTLARIDERTQILLGGDPAERRARRHATPAHGIPIAAGKRGAPPPPDRES